MHHNTTYKVKPFLSAQGKTCQKLSAHSIHLLENCITTQLTRCKKILSLPPPTYRKNPKCPTSKYWKFFKCHPTKSKVYFLLIYTKILSAMFGHLPSAPLLFVSWSNPCKISECKSDMVMKVPTILLSSFSLPSPMDSFPPPQYEYLLPPLWCLTPPPQYVCCPPPPSDEFHPVVIGQNSFIYFEVVNHRQWMPRQYDQIHLIFLEEFK